MANETEHWLFDREGKPSQCCGPDKAVAERQKAFFDSLLTNRGPYTIRLMLKRVFDDIEPQTWRRQRAHPKAKPRQRYRKLLDQGVRPAQSLGRMSEAIAATRRRSDDE